MIEAATPSQIVLSGLMNSMRRLETYDFSSSWFQGRDKSLFQALSAQWGNRKTERIGPGEIMELAKTMGGNGVISYLSDLQDRWKPPSEDNFKTYLAKVREFFFRNQILQKTRTPDFDSSEIRAALDEIERTNPEKTRGPELHWLSTIQPEPIEWLWPGYFPLKKMALLSGDPGHGKSYFVLNLAAIVSTGRPWPDGSPSGIPGKILILSCEDGAADTIRPRLDQLGADVSKIALINDAVDLGADDGPAYFSAKIEIVKPRLVIADPIFDFSGGINPNAAEKVRAMLSPLAKITERANACFIFTSHLNKASTFQALYRTSGSASGWMGKVRAGFIIVYDREETNLRFFSPVKANLSPEEPRDMAFRIAQSGLLFERVPDEYNLQDQLSKDAAKYSPRLQEAKDLILRELQGGPAKAEDVRQKSKDAKITEITLNRAKNSLHVVSFRSGGSFGEWYWRLPQ